jgi:hypothetical protein
VQGITATTMLISTTWTMRMYEEKKSLRKFLSRASPASSSASHKSRAMFPQLSPVAICNKVNMLSAKLPKCTSSCVPKRS